MSPQPEDMPHTGQLGQDSENYERQRIAELKSQQAAEKLNEAQKDRPLREDFGGKEEESWDDPQSTREAIGGMAASRAPALVRAAREAATRLPAVPPPPPPTRSQEPVDMALVVRSVVSELSRELSQTFANLKEDIDANTRLLGVMSAPMEAITDSHERAAASFETLRSEISQIAGTGSSPAIEALAKVVDTAGLHEASTRAEQRMEQLALNIDRRMTDLLHRFDLVTKAITLDMAKVLHLLERLQARELREAKDRMKGAAGV